MKNSIFIAILAIFGSIESLTIDCVYDEAHWPVLGEAYQCRVWSLQNEADHTVTNVTGSHLPGRSNDDVGLITIYGRWTVDFIPRGLTSFFPNLRGFRSQETAIETLNGDEFDEFGENFVYLTMQLSNLTTISSRLFDHTPNIELVDFWGSTIQRVGHDLFTPVKGLQYIDFRVASCINEFAYDLDGAQVVISNLRVLCPYDDEEVMTTTEATINTTIETTTAEYETTTTTGGHSCDVGNINEFVCELNKNLSGVQSDLNDSKDELQLELNDSNRRIKALEVEIEWMREELLRLMESLSASK
jgi:hypothetical protein